MLTIDRTLIRAIRATTNPKDLFPSLQGAIELEHATIPPYLTCLMSFHPGSNVEVRGLIRSIVVEEMLHMTIACNVLNALGGAPALTQATLVPEYPTKLPMGVHPELLVGLAAFSPSLVDKVFMEIEEPKHPIEFPGSSGRQHSAGTGEEDFTIGEFYSAIQEAINALSGPDLLPGDASRQLTNTMFSTKDLFPVHTKADANRALQVIIDQGEGTTKSPIDLDGNVAHYYRFEEVLVGKTLVEEPSSPCGYAFGGAAIPHDPSKVFPLKGNMKASDLPEGSELRRLAELFNTNYGRLLRGLNRAFNGEPDFLLQTMGLMYDIKLLGERLAATPFPSDNSLHCCPPFEYESA